MSTALVGVLGACFALCTQSPRGTGKMRPVNIPSNPILMMEDHSEVARISHKCFVPFLENASAWILPFTSGGFLYIALVNVMPDLLQETSLRCVGCFPALMLLTLWTSSSFCFGHIFMHFGFIFTAIWSRECMYFVKYNSKFHKSLRIHILSCYGIMLCWGTYYFISFTEYFWYKHCILDNFLE